MAGSGKTGFKDGKGTEVEFNYPFSVAVDQKTGDVYVVDSSNKAIRKVTPQGTFLLLLLFVILF